MRYDVSKTDPSPVSTAADFVAASSVSKNALRLNKRAVDVALACAGLVLLSPLLLLVAVAIRLESSGPAIFRQKRAGCCGRTFKIWKFRTMRVLEDDAVVRQATSSDPRVTRLGRILRKTSMDELPQLINVLLGDMSIVGPRPHALAHNRYYSDLIPGYARRLSMPPGITGWAQINGARGETPTLDHMRKRVDLDLWYIEHYSLQLDISIVLRTVVTEILGKSKAY